MNFYYKNIKKQCALFGLLGYFSVFSAYAQTQPTPQLIPYYQNFDTFNGSANVSYPIGMQGWQVVASVPSTVGRTSEPIADIDLTPNGSAASTNSGIYDFSGKIGMLNSSVNTVAIALALNTSSILSPKRIRVIFDGSVIRNTYNGGTNNILNGIILQYRIGSSGEFTNAGNSVKNGSTMQTSGTTGIDGKNFSTLLPIECSNQPLLQLRWSVRTISGSTGSERPSLAIDNISVTGEDPIQPQPFTGYSISSRNITLSGSSTTYATNMLSGVTRTQVLSNYGGSKDDYVGNPTGYFTTYKDATDVWYMIDPDGYKFYSLGVNTVIAQRGIDAINTIKSVYSNTIGNFSDENLISMPYCVRLNLGYTYRTTSSLNTTLYNNSILPVFDPGFVSYCASQVDAQITPARIIDKNLLGYFSDNEVPLANSSTGNKLIVRWLDVSLYGGQSVADGNPNYQAAVSWMKSRHGGTLTTPSTADANEWPGQVAAKYYSICRNAIKSKDSNHLYIGSRLHQDLANPYQFTAAGQYLDVLSVNNYNVWSPAQLSARYDVWEASANRPFLVTEFYAQADDSGLPNTSGAGFNVKTQQDRADFFEHYTMELLKRKMNIGFQYFKLNDDPAASNKGLLNTDYDWWEPMRASYTKIAQDVYRLRKYLIFGDQSLPITLKTFTAKADLNKVKIEWSTSSEINNERFEVQRSSNGVDFKTIYTVKGKGNSLLAASYSTYDESPQSGSNYYKLIQYDLDGKFKIEGVRVVNFIIKENGASFTIFPIPAAAEINIRLSNFYAATALVNLYDFSGKLIYKENLIVPAGDSSHRLKLNTKLKSGQYFLQIKTGTIIKTEKLLVL